MVCSRKHWPQYMDSGLAHLQNDFFFFFFFFFSPRLPESFIVPRLPKGVGMSGVYHPSLNLHYYIKSSDSYDFGTRGRYESPPLITKKYQ